MILLLFLQWFGRQTEDGKNIKPCRTLANKPTLTASPQMGVIGGRRTPSSSTVVILGYMSDALPLQNTNDAGCSESAMAKRKKNTFDLALTKYANKQEVKINVCIATRSFCLVTMNLMARKRAPLLASDLIRPAIYYIQCDLTDERQLSLSYTKASKARIHKKTTTLLIYI